jgi:hypothetical protein
VIERQRIVVGAAFEPLGRGHLRAAFDEQDAAAVCDRTLGEQHPGDAASQDAEIRAAFTREGGHHRR